MKIAVVGAGFSGLALSYFLLSLGAEVTLYDQKGVGGGASSASCGLVHPYTGEQVRRSYKATEALEEVKNLLKIAKTFSRTPLADFSGILRKADPKQAAIFVEHAEKYKDIEVLSNNLFLLKSGIFVRSEEYLKALYKACSSLGLKSSLQKIETVNALEKYDTFVLALGAGIFSFSGIDTAKFSFIKGQSLLCRWPFAPLEKPILGKGHVAQSSEISHVYLGATYERGILEEEASPLVALSLLKAQAQKLFPDWTDIIVDECRAGRRVMYKGHAVPWSGKVGRGWMLAGMGSRGLLYHGFFAKKLSEAILQKSNCSFSKDGTLLI